MPQKRAEFSCLTCGRPVVAFVVWDKPPAELVRVRKTWMVQKNVFALRQLRPSLALDDDLQAGQPCGKSDDARPAVAMKTRLLMVA